MAQHLMSNSKLYRKWRSMKRRCLDEKDKSYESYGGKGISVCKQWYKFENFRDWAFENGYVEGLTIDRIDNAKGYDPNNCRWVTSAEQQRNKSTNIFTEINGETLCLSEVFRKYGEEYKISYESLKYRYKRGLRGLELLRPAHSGKRL